eukprot:m.43268 g.43268  ORF g.43268 m.43268 type:complete len:454 (-) comp14424_c0_seq1:64-1425(-)
MGAEQSTAAPKPSGAKAQAHYFLDHIRARFEELAQAREPADSVERKLIVAILSTPGAEDFGELLFEHSDQQTVNVHEYTQAIFAALGLDTGSKPVEPRCVYFFRAFCQGKDTMDDAGLRKLVHAACTLALASGLVDSQPVVSDKNSSLQGLVASALAAVKDPTAITADEFRDWVVATCPDLFCGMVRWIELQALSHSEAGSAVPEEHAWTAGHSLPVFDGHEGGDRLLDYAGLWALTISLPELYKASPVWTLLYCSRQHGMSFNRFQHHVGMYAGPTVLILEDAAGHRFGAAVDCEWKESDHPRGGENCRVFTLAPLFNMPRKHIKVYENSKGRHTAHGLGFGEDASTAETAMMWVEQDLQKAYVQYKPLGQPHAATTIIVTSVEVWGCGSKDVSDKQRAERIRDQRAAELKQKTKRPGKWESGEDRYLLDLAGVHVSEARLDVGKERAGRID